MSSEASLQDDGNLHCPERHELFRQVEHRGSVAGALAKALQVSGVDTFLAGIAECALLRQRRACSGRVQLDPGDRAATRTVGTMRGQRARVHTFRKYDVDVDTSIAAPRECPEAILAVLDARPASRLPPAP